jgi:hypothetical protein
MGTLKVFLDFQATSEPGVPEVLTRAGELAGLMADSRV